MPRRARVSAQEGPRLPDGTFTPRPGSPYYTKHSEYRSGGAWDPAKRKARKGKKSGSGRARRAGRRVGSTVTSGSGRTYKMTAAGNWSLVRGKSKGKGRGRKSRGRKSAKRGRRRSRR